MTIPHIDRLGVLADAHVLIGSTIGSTTPTTPTEHAYVDTIVDMARAMLGASNPDHMGHWLVRTLILDTDWDPSALEIIDRARQTVEALDQDPDLLTTRINAVVDMVLITLGISPDLGLFIRSLVCDPRPSDGVDLSVEEPEIVPYAPGSPLWGMEARLPEHGDSFVDGGQPEYEYTFAVGVTAYGVDRADAERKVIDLLADGTAARHGFSERLRISDWWVAEDDRSDDSDQDSAIWVPLGSQRAAVEVLDQYLRTDAYPDDVYESF